MGRAETVGNVCDFLLWWIFGGNLVSAEAKNVPTTLEFTTPVKAVKISAFPARSNIFFC